MKNSPRILAVSADNRFSPVVTRLLSQLSLRGLPSRTSELKELQCLTLRLVCMRWEEGDEEASFGRSLLKLLSLWRSSSKIHWEEKVSKALGEPGEASLRSWWTNMEARARFWASRSWILLLRLPTSSLKPWKWRIYLIIIAENEKQLKYKINII